MDFHNNVTLKVILALILVQLLYAGLQILLKVVLGEAGLSTYALVTYRQLVAAIFLVPFVFIFERGAVKNVTFTIFCWLFLAAMMGITLSTILFYEGLKCTTATFAMGMNNLIPAITFVLSVVFRLENLEFNTGVGRKKIIGAILCLAGALVISFYEGKSFHLGNHHGHGSTIVIKAAKNGIRGTLFIFSGCVTYAVWYILQVRLEQIFPHRYSKTMLTCIIAALQTVVVGLFVDHQPNAWRLSWNLQLTTIVYSGIFATAVSFVLVVWAVSKRGPTYPTMFGPLSLILIVFVEAIFLGEAIHVGSLIGMALIVAGLYLFLWGRNNETNGQQQNGETETRVQDGEANDPSGKC